MLSGRHPVPFNVLGECEAEALPERLGHEARECAAKELRRAAGAAVSLAGTQVREPAKPVKNGGPSNHCTCETSRKNSRASTVLFRLAAE